MLEWSFASITIVSDTFRSLEESMERKYPQPLRFQMLHVRNTHFVLRLVACYNFHYNLHGQCIRLSSASSLADCSI